MIFQGFTTIKLMFLDLNPGLTGNKTHTLNHYNTKLYRGDFRYKVETLY